MRTDSAYSVAKIPDGCWRMGITAGFVINSKKNLVGGGYFSYICK